MLGSIGAWWMIRSEWSKEEATATQEVVRRQELATAQNDAQEIVQQAIASGTIHRVDARAREVQVNPLIWATWNADAKRAFTITLASYCDIKNRGDGIGLVFVDIIDSQTGKKLARLGVTGAFEVY